MHLQAHLMVNYREFHGLDASVSVSDMFTMWCQGVIDGDMADNLAIMMVARRYNIKLLVWQPPPPDAFAQCKRKNKAFRPGSTPFLDMEGPHRRVNAFLLQFDLGVQHFEPVLPIEGESHQPYRFTIAERAREGYDPVLNIQYRSSAMIAKVKMPNMMCNTDVECVQHSHVVTCPIHEVQFPTHGEYET